MSVPRLALCGNVFPADGPDAVLAALSGPVAEWSAGLKRQGLKAPFALGLHCSASAAAAFTASAAARRQLQQAMAAAEVVTWTANAFPFGDFHASRVKEKAFLPDWTHPERLHFTLQVAELLAWLAPEESRSLSISTCPLGYGPDALHHPDSLKHLQAAAVGLQELGARFHKDFCLALEPEPDGAFEKVGDLAPWLAEHIPADLLPQLGVCWDLCHAAVVGESTADILQTLQQTGVRVGKVQISSALKLPGRPSAADLVLLQALTDDPYLHQVRGRNARGEAAACRDLPQYLQHAPASDWTDLHIHCHVPVSISDYPGGLQGTPWQEAVRACLDHGIRDFELETYTLPVLPAELLQQQGLVGVMVAETLACMRTLELDTTPA